MDLSKGQLDRVAVHVSKSRRLVIDPYAIYYLEAARADTILRRRSRRTLRDVRTLGELARVFEPFGFYRVHHKWIVNVRSVREIRLQRDERDWEVVMLPPVNRVIPISRRRHDGFLKLIRG